jgi:hypothetical protein
MSRLLRLFGPLAIVCGLASPVWAQMTPLARLACTSQNYPSCGGWGPAGESQNGTTWFRRTLLPGAGPGGLDAVEFMQQPHGGGQYYLGWFSPGSGIPGASQGAVRYFRVKIFTPNPSTATNQFWGSKFIILGDASGDTSSRVICELRDNGMTTNTLSIRCMQNIYGGERGTQLLSLPLGQWVSIQAEIRSSTSTSSGNGQIKVWVNSNDYSHPTGVSPQFQQNVTRWENINVGFHAGSNATTSQHLLYRIAVFEFDDQFDPNWASGGGGSTPPPSPSAPAPPTNVHIVRTASLTLMPFAGLGLVLGIARRKRA